MTNIKDRERGKRRMAAPQKLSLGGRTMSQTFTKAMARNIFYGGTLFFLLLFLALSFDSVSALPERDNRQNLTETVAQGKILWEENNCIGCHTLLYVSEINTANWPPNIQG
ncbi:MAG: hypothetical protein AB2812_05995 [Candidatus Sedimenticola endophacoides]